MVDPQMAERWSQQQRGCNTTNQNWTFHKKCKTTEWKSEKAANIQYIDIYQSMKTE